MKYLSVILILGCLGMLCFAPAAHAATEVEERRDFEVADSDGVFRQALKEIENYMPEGFDAERLSQNKYYIQAIREEWGELGAEFMLVMVDDGTSPGSYYTVLYEMPEMWPIYFIYDTYEPPIDDYFQRVINMYATAALREDFDDEIYEDDDEYETETAAISSPGSMIPPNLHSILDAINKK